MRLVAAVLAVAVVAGGITLALYEPAEAETPRVSTKVFGGPMVVEVILDGPYDAEPEVMLGGSYLRMTQGTDGKWYAYIADTHAARAADGATGIAGTGMDFGTECGNPGFLEGQFDPAAVVFTSGRTCDPATDPGFMQVVGAARLPATDVPGGNGLSDADHWPFIQTFEMERRTDISHGGSPVSMGYASSPCWLELDRESYPPDTDVRLTLYDHHLNVDPTSADLWTFDADGSGEIYRLLFDRAGNLVDAGGEALDPGRIYHYGGVEYGGGYAYGAVGISADTPGAVYAADNSLQDSTQVPTLDGALVTVRETASNSGVFTNTDRIGAANLRTGDVQGTHGFAVSCGPRTQDAVLAGG